MMNKPVFTAASLVFVVLALILAACTSTPAPTDTTARVPALTPTPPAGPLVQLSALSTTTASPLGSLALSGTGLTQAGSAVSVRFIPANGGPAITVPVSGPSSTGLQVMVPPLIDRASGRPVSGPVDVQVIQVSGTTVQTSNLIKGFQIAPLPPVPAGEPTGTKTLALLNSALTVFQTTRKALNSDPKASAITAAAPAYESNLRLLIAAAGTVTKIPGMSFPFSTTSGSTLVLDAKALALSDQMAQALIAELASKTQAPATGATPGAAKGRFVPVSMVRGFAPCPMYPNDPTAYDTNLCWVERFFQNLTPGENPAVDLQMQQVLANLLAATLPVPPYMADQILAGVLGTFGVAYATTGEPPPGADVVEGIGTSAMDAWGKTNGMLGLVIDIYKILHLAATTFPSQGRIPIERAIAVSDAAGNTYLLYPDGAKLVQVPPVQGSFLIDSLALVVSPTRVTPSFGSIYDGVYSGTFAYEYQEQKYENGNLVSGPWIAKSLMLTLTFKVINEMDYYGRKTAIVQITHVFANDPAFGTGVSGIDLPPGSGAAYLPADPPATPSNPSTVAMLIVIRFPNGAEFGTPALAGALLVSANGKTLSNSSDPSILRTWAASVPQGRLGWSGDPKADLKYNYKSWTLTKKLTE